MSAYDSPAVQALGSLADLGSRRFWRTVGRPIDLDGDEHWLRAPRATGSRVGDAWLRAWADENACELRTGGDTGLLSNMNVLDGPGFDANRLHPLVREFYEHTTRFRMEVWMQWNPLAWPAAEVVRVGFGRRVDQLALPSKPLDVAYGMDSDVTVLERPDGSQLSAGWLRTLRSTGEHVYSGCYTASTLPGADRASVHVSFPLEKGNVQVFLRPDIGDDGSLTLTSGRGGFGDNGCYTVVDNGDRDHCARAPLHEKFHLYVDDESVLRTDHELNVWSIPAARLHFKLLRIA